MQFKYALFLLCFSTLNYAQNIPVDNSPALDLIELLGELDDDTTTLDIAMTELAQQKPSIKKLDIKKPHIEKPLMKPLIKPPAGGEQ